MIFFFFQNMIRKNNGQKDSLKLKTKIIPINVVIKLQVNKTRQDKQRHKDNILGIHMHLIPRLEVGKTQALNCHKLFPPSLLD